MIFRASAASVQLQNVCQKPMVWHLETLKYSYQREEPKAFVELFTYIRVHFSNILTHIVLFRRNSVQRYDQDRWKNLDIKGNTFKEI